MSRLIVIDIRKGINSSSGGTRVLGSNSSSGSNRIRSGNSSSSIAHISSGRILLTIVDHLAVNHVMMSLMMMMAKMPIRRRQPLLMLLGRPSVTATASVAATAAITTITGSTQKKSGRIGLRRLRAVRRHVLIVLGHVRIVVVVVAAIRVEIGRCGRVLMVMVMLV